MPRGLRAIREMLRRCAAGSVYEVLLELSQLCAGGWLFTRSQVLYKVEDRHSIADWGEKTRPLRIEEKIASAIYCA